MAKAVRTYDFNLSAGQTSVILAEGEYFRIQSATGALDVTVEGVGTLPGLLAGQGMMDTPFKRLVLKDASGSTNSGTILVASREFIDNRTYGVMTISNQQGAFTHTQVTVQNFNGGLKAPNANRRYLLIQNKDASGDIYVTTDGTAASTANGVKIAPGGSWELQGYVPTGWINGIGSIASNANVVVVEG